MPNVIDGIIIKSKNSIFGAEKTKVIYGVENVINRALHMISLTKKTLDLYGESAGLHIIVANEPIVKEYTEAKNRGVRIRHITEITEENLRNCNILMSLMDIRHLDGLKGYLTIQDEEVFICHAFGQEGKSLPHMVVSTVKVLVEQQRYFFDMLWSKAIPAKQRIREIEKGAKREFIETIRDPSEIQKVGFDLIKAAQEEIQIIFSTDSAFYRQIKDGMLQLLKEAAAARGVKIRILVPMDNKIRNEMAEQLEGLGVDIRDSKKSLLAKVTTLVVDNALSLTVESKYDLEERSGGEEGEAESIGLATYSNSDSTVLTHVSIFENMWMHDYSKETRQNKKTLPATPVA